GKLFKQNRNRFRDQVIVIIRNAQMSDLADPGLTLIKSQILARTNSLLGEPLLKQVLFSDFAAVQQ
ncbi:MAG TPA: flagellar basal body-associated FliL family protein, partial [Pirellulales bacterium]|nr:flagellar basal body-associated FliL family protein [Pirellulales bacterium]